MDRENADFYKFRRIQKRFGSKVEALQIPSGTYLFSGVVDLHNMKLTAAMPLKRRYTVI
jgi:translation elongation factor EF-G